MDIKILDEKARMPVRAHETDAGLDLYAIEHAFIPKGGTTKIATGVAFAIPDGCVGMICDRSSMALRGMVVGGGIIDIGYTGELSVVLHNLTNDRYPGPGPGSVRGVYIVPGEKVAQLLIVPIAFPVLRVVKELSPVGDRGSEGFGSTGR